MAKKAEDRLAVLRQRASSYTQTSHVDAEDVTTNTTIGQPAPDGATRLHFGLEPLDRLTEGRRVEQITVGLIAPDLRLEHRQPRLLPLPDELLVEGKSVPGYEQLVTELFQLGTSLGERQLQPIVVYPGNSELFPAARYLLLVGHRRWTASVLSARPTIQALIIDPPSPAERVSAQYAENEERSEFADMERAWSFMQMKQAMGDVAWEEVETRLNISRSRRQDLLRLMAFSPEQQQVIARLRIGETQIRPLHTAVRNQTIAASDVDTILQKLPPKTQGPAVARLVARTQRAAQSTEKPAAPQWLTLLYNQLDHTTTTLGRAQRRVGELDEQHANDLTERVKALRARLQTMLDTVDRSI